MTVAIPIRSLFLGATLLLASPASDLLASTRSGGQICIGRSASACEQYAARELQRYLYQLSGDWLPIAEGTKAPHQPAFVLGTATTQPLFSGLASEGRLPDPPQPLGSQGYRLRQLTVGHSPILVIQGADEIGVLYGVYGLLEDHYGVRFHLGGDVFPEGQLPLTWPVIDECKTPAVDVRGFLPWTNFPQSATSYSWEDWRFILDQMARMRLNFLHIHNYNGEAGHNEMFHNFTLDGFTSRVWMATARSGHRWACPGWDLSEYRFGANSLFDDYDFGADCALHNERLSNEDVFAKGVVQFQRVIAHAHSRGIRIGLGLDINLIPPEYKTRADDPRVVQARVHQIVTDYPDLDYILCFQSEGLARDEAGYQGWRRIFMGFYEGIKARSPRTRLAVAGWGLDPKSIATLPSDVICAPISAYSDGCESGAIYGDREYWGCPWLERDFNSSEYYYPYNMHLSNTVRAWQQRAPNMKGFYVLTWRLTDAVEAKMWYVSNAPWDQSNRLNSSRAVYADYARAHYGPEAAEVVTPIIDQNEPFASDFGECEGTPGFVRGGRSGTLLNIAHFQLIEDDATRGHAYEASAFSSEHGVQRAPCVEGGECVGYIEPGDCIRFDALDFGKRTTAFEARVASATEGGQIELRLDGPDGPVLGTGTVTNSGGWQNWYTLRIPLTPASATHPLHLNFLPPAARMSDLPKATAQLAAIDEWMRRPLSPARLDRLGRLRARIAAVRDHIELNEHFNDYRWEDLPGAMESWARNFTRRVIDISSLGNVMSVQNRFVQLNYVAKETALRAGQSVKAPSHVVVRGTKEGPRITWQNEEPGARSFNLYRDGRPVLTRPLPPTTRSFRDRAAGAVRYTVTAIGDAGRESPHSIPVTCMAGEADRQPPQLVVISPPTSVPAGQDADLKVRLLDDRDDPDLRAVARVRIPGRSRWQRIELTRRVKGVFATRIPAHRIPAAGLEYYFEASDGMNQAVYPPSAPEHPLSLVTAPPAHGRAPGRPALIVGTEGKLNWERPGGDVFLYRIYRGVTPGFAPGPATLLTYVAGRTTGFHDANPGFDGAPLAGPVYYRVAAVDAAGHEGPASQPVRMELRERSFRAN